MDNKRYSTQSTVRKRFFFKIYGTGDDETGVVVSRIAATKHDAENMILSAYTGVTRLEFLFVK